MERFVKLLIKNRSIVLMVLLFVFLFGAYAYYDIPKQENPDTTIAVAVVTTIYAGASPQEVETLVTIPIEEKIKTLPHVDYYTSKSVNSASAIIIYYENEYSIDDVKPELQSAISDVQTELPDMCSESVISTDLITNNQFIISLYGENYSETDLVEYAGILKSALEEVDGVTSVTVDGEKEKQVVVEADIDQLQLYGVSIENILQVLQAQNLTIPSGSISYESGTIDVVASGVFESLADIENTVIGGAEDSLSFVKIKDVAKVYITEADSYQYSQDGQPAVLVVGKFQEDENAVNIGKRVRQELDQVMAQLPEDLGCHEVLFAPEAIDESIRGFIVSLVESVALIILVVMIGAKFRNALVISVALPTTILITFICMWLMDINFHFISIAALIVSLGILIDNAIVISDAIQQKLDGGLGRLEACSAAAKETAVPILTSTLTTIVTFSVIYFVPGTVGQVAGTIPTVVIISLCASFVVAMTVIPVLAFMFFKPGGRKNAKPEGEGWALSRLLRLQSACLDHPGATLGMAFATLGVAALLVANLGLSFFPGADKPILYINISGEALNLEKTGEIVEDIQQVLDDSGMVDNYTAAVGKGLPSFFLTVVSLTEADNTAQIMLEMDPEKLAEFSSNSEAASYLQQLIDRSVTGATVEVKYLEYSMPTDDTIALSVCGDDQQTINSAAEAIAEALRQIPGTDNVRTNIKPNQYQYSIKLDSELLSSYGLLKYDVVKQLNTSVMGATATTYTTSDASLDVVVKANVQSLDDLMRLPISGSAAPVQVTLGQVAEVELSTTTTMIERYNGKRYVNVLSGVQSGYSSLYIENQLNRDFLSSADLGEVEVISRGEVSNMMDLISNLGVAAVAAILIIYFILYIQFHDFIKPLNIMTSIPLSLIGCFLGLYVMQMDLQVMALLGVVSLFGIVVNNGILLLEVMGEERSRGTGVREACRLASLRRFRAIMMTSITTCIGLVPLIIEGDPMAAPMAIVLFFGLIFSTFLTLLVVPTIYYNSEKRKLGKLAASAGPSEEGREDV